MPHPKAVHAAPTVLVASAFYKTDHPRRIDYHIDFFGDDTPARLTAIEICCEAVLRMPA